MRTSLKKTGLLLAICMFSTPFYAENIIIKPVSSTTQQSITPETALVKLKEGNGRFVNQTMRTRDLNKQARLSSYGQHPWAVVLNCMDSRSVPEFIFDQGLADLFTLRVAGNVLNDDILGSMEFATKAVGAPLIVVLGHTACGAVAGACEGVNLGHLDGVLNKIKPVLALSEKEASSKSCKDHHLIDTMAKNNALDVARQIKERSPIIRKLIESGQVGIVAGIHDIKTGKVVFFEEKSLISESKNPK